MSKKQELPDARRHQQISFIKSGIRILGYGALWYSLDIAVILLILSEIASISKLYHKSQYSMTRMHDMIKLSC